MSCFRRCVLLGALMLAPATAHAQFGMGFGGDPFMMIGGQMVPSPTQFLNDRSNILTQNAAAQQANLGRLTAPYRDNSNSYFNRIRDFSGEWSFDVSSRRSLSDRVSRAPAPAPRPTAAAASALPDLALATFVKDDGMLDWPRDAPSDGNLRSFREEADLAVKAVFEQMKSGGTPKAQSVGTAKWKVISYGQHALAKVRSDRPEAISKVFHYYLLFLHQALDRLGAAPPPAG